MHPLATIHSSCGLKRERIRPAKLSHGMAHVPGHSRAASENRDESIF
jgi:hypothetical protein